MEVWIKQLYIAIYKRNISCDYIFVNLESNDIGYADHGFLITADKNIYWKHIQKYINDIRIYETVD